jgi:hypothetical protein
VGHVLYERDFNTISSMLHGLSEALGLSIVSENVDRHGSLIWEAGRRDDLNRYLTFALTEIGRDSSEPVIAELWIGADNGNRYARKLVQSWPFAPEHDLLDYPEIGGPRLRSEEMQLPGKRVVLPLATSGGKIIGAEAAGAKLIFRMGWAWNCVAHLSEAELSEEFVIPRLPPQEKHVRA